MEGAGERGGTGQALKCGPHLFWSRLIQPLPQTEGGVFIPSFGCRSVNICCFVLTTCDFHFSTEHAHCCSGIQIAKHI